MTKSKDIEKMAEELGLNKERIATGLKSNPKEVTQAVEKAYAFKIKHKKK